MGIGIGIDILNKTDYDVIFIDISDPSLQRAKKDISAYFSDMVEWGRLLAEQMNDFMNRVIYTKDFAVLKNAEVIWEVATERLDVKQIIFANIEKHADPKKLIFIFSNTSSHTTAELA